MPDSIVLAYSGGLDTSVAVHHLGRVHAADVTALLVDLGQDPRTTADAKARALSNGAADCLVVPAREDFAEGYVAPAIQADALYEGAYPLGTALSRPLIAKALVDAAHRVGADAVAHGCTGKGNDQVRIENGIRALDPSLAILAPQRTHPMDRPQAVAYAKENGLQLPPGGQSRYSVDENLWTRSVEGDDLEDPAVPVPEAAYAWTLPPERTPATAQEVTLTFKGGLPCALDGVHHPLADLITILNRLMGEHGIGRIDHVESRVVGIKSREVYEAPAAVAVLTAKKALEALTLTRDELATKAPMEALFARLCYDGHHWGQVMHATKAFLASITTHVDGEVTLKAHQGRLTVTGRASTKSLYEPALATYGAADAFDHEAAGGFLTISGLPLAAAARARAVHHDGAPDGKGPATVVPITGGRTVA